jgi:hypothetical protein
MYNYRIGIDGNLPFGVIASDGCCPPDICSLSADDLACSAVGLLPSGPLWDKSKEFAIACNYDCGASCDEPVGEDEALCGTLVQHAIYAAKRLHYLIKSALWPSVRESNPYTAFTTMDSWLDRLGWQDCYNNFCRDPALGEMTPYEILGECGIVYCEPDFGRELELIYKRGVIVALWRLRHGIAQNLASINFILSSLYAELVIDPNYDPAVDATPCLILQSTADTAPVVLKEPCPETDATILAAQKQVKLYLTPGKGLCVGGPARAYPLVLAAHCIVRSLLPNCCKICLKREP